MCVCVLEKEEGVGKEEGVEKEVRVEEERKRGIKTTGRLSKQEEVHRSKEGKQMTRRRGPEHRKAEESGVNEVQA